MPDIRPLALRAAELLRDDPVDSRLLNSLAQISRRANRVGHPGCLEAFYEENRDVWSYRNDIDDPMAIHFMIVELVKRIQEDLMGFGGPGQATRTKHPVIDANEASEKVKPVWVEKDFELWFDGDLIRSVKVDAINIITILHVFHEEKWEPIDDPLPGPWESQRQRLDDAIASLNSLLAENTISFHVFGKNRIRWKSS